MLEVKIPFVVPSEVWLPLIDSVPDVVLQQTPSAVILAYPSDVILPPPATVSTVMFLRAAVVIVGTKGANVVKVSSLP